MVASVLIQVSVVLFGANPYLERGRTLYGQLRYAEAGVELERACQVPGNSRAERREAHDLLARALVAEGAMEKAQAVYGRLLQEDPMAPLPEGASPKVKGLFLEAKQKLFPPDFVELGSLLSVLGTIRVGVVDPWERVESLVLFEADEAGAFVSRELEVKEAEARATLRKPGPGALAWYVEARRGAGVVLATLGSASNPMVFRGQSAEPSPEAPNAELAQSPDGFEGSPAPSWPAWTALGASALAAGTGVWLVTSSEEAYRAAGRAEGVERMRELEARYRAQAVWGRVALGAALACGATAAVLFLK